MRISILTMCPDCFNSFLETPLIQRAVKEQRLEMEILDIRERTKGCFRKIDDSPYGGGRGMIIRCQPVVDTLEEIRTADSHVVILSPTGQPFRQKKARELSGKSHLVLICGHYEGMDERIYSYADEILSIGDYVLTGGELPAMVVTETAVRLLEGSLREGSADEESFEEGLLEYPQYTRPRVFRGLEVPEVLLSGNHEAIRQWRREQSLLRTRKYRPDL